MKSIGILVFMVFMFSITACKKDHCDDGKNNKDEAGLDCGGKDCKPCESCFDGITNQGELGVDCGGPCAICQLEWKEVRTGTTKLTAVNFYKNVVYQYQQGSAYLAILKLSQYGIHNHQSNLIH